MTMAQQDLFIESGVEEITPQQAALWLEGANLHNRPLQMDRAKAICAAILRGEWALNGDAIRFCTNGQLIDGQHRLQGIVLACKPVKSLVVRGLAPNSFATIDTNRTVRSGRDVLALSGIQNYSIAAPAARLMHYFETTGNPYDNRAERSPSAQQLVEIASRPEFAKVAGRAFTLRWCKRFLTPALTSFALYLFSQHRKEHAEQFFAKLETGIGLEQGSPILLLRDRLINVGPQDRMKPVARAAYLFKAWRLYLLGANVKQLKLVFSKSTPMKDHFQMERRGEGQ